MQKKILIYVVLIFILISCNATNTDNCHKIITIINNSDKTIYVSNTGRYPETDFTKIIGNPLLSGAPKTDANKSNLYGIVNGGECFENTFPRFESGIMQVFLFEATILESKGWDYMKTNNLVLKRYQFTLQELKNNNWTITYP